MIKRMNKTMPLMVGVFVGYTVGQLIPRNAYPNSQSPVLPSDTVNQNSINNLSHVSTVNQSTNRDLTLHDMVQQKKDWKQIAMEYGLPSMENVQMYPHYITSHNFERRTPNWVLQVVEKGENKKKVTASRSYSSFNSQNVIGVPDQFKQSNYDYMGSGYSKGHLVAASFMTRKDQKAMDDTFILNSNIVPQNYDNNANYWYKMELWTRLFLPSRFDKVWIASGPLFVPQEVERMVNNRKKKKKYMVYEVIGRNNVAAPNFLFKVILAENKDGEKYVDAFVVPNAPIDSEKPLMDFKVPLEYIENYAGLQFFSKLRENEELNSLCDKEDGHYCQLLRGREWKIYDNKRKLYWSLDEKSLNKVRSFLEAEGEWNNDCEKQYQNQLSSQALKDLHPGPNPDEVEKIK